MAQTRALRLSGRARSIDHDRRVVGVGRFGPLAEQRCEACAALAPAPQKLAVAYDTFSRARGRLVEHDHSFHFRQTRAHAHDLVELRARVHEHKLRVRVFDDVMALLGGTGRIEADADAARANGADVRDRPLRHVAHQDAHARAARQPMREQGRCELMRLLIEPRPRDAVPTVCAAEEENVVRACADARAKMRDALAEERVDVRVLH